jgi:Endopolygalacturonase
MASPMRRVNEMVSSEIGNYLTNKKTWNIIYNVKDYGAKGDGKTDDTAAIAKTFDAMTNGGIIHFPDGVYIISGLVISNKDDFLITASPSARLKRKRLYLGNLITFNYCSRFRLSGVYIENDDGTIATTLTDAINTSVTTIPVVSTADYPATGTFFLSTFERVEYTGKTATSFTGCIRGASGSGARSAPAGEIVRPLYGYGVDIFACQQFEIESSTFKGNYDHNGADLLSLRADTTQIPRGDGAYTYTVNTACENGNIHHNSFIDSGEEGAISRQGCFYINFHNNYFYNCWGTGITIKGEMSFVKDNIFVQCYIGTEVNAESSIVGQGNRVVVDGNQFYNCNFAIFGSTISDALQNNLPYVERYIVTNNRIKDTLTSAIWLRFVDNVHISGNHVENVSNVVEREFGGNGVGAGIYAFRTGNSKFIDNRIEGATSNLSNFASVYIQNSDNAEVFQNHVVGSAPTDRILYVTNCNGTQVDENTIVDGYIGLNSVSDCSANENKITNGQLGILLTGSSSKNQINSNKITTVQQYGIRLLATGAQVQSYNDVKTNQIVNASSSTNGGFAAIQVVMNTNCDVSYNSCISDGTNKPNFGVQFDTNTSASVARYNTIVGFTSSFPISNQGTNNTIVQSGFLSSVAATPNFIGQQAIVSGVGYMAVGTSSSADWKQITN